MGSTGPNWVQPARKTWVRVVLLAMALLFLAMLAVGTQLNPNRADGTPKNWGTHQQLGLAPCHFLVLTGRPCPSCGLTTSVTQLMHGNILASLRVNWLGTILAVVAIVAVPRYVWLVRRGRPWELEKALDQFFQFGLVWSALLLIRWGWVLLWHKGPEA